MSRREFRGQVEAPRPAAAWVMSIVASASVWLTEQLPVWVIAVQILAFAVSFATRHNPPAFRRSPIWLNIMMAVVTTITIRSALAGNPATVSLTYFTSLAQGLQLMDTRPRKSEFVLVALALFQVILASNLTDSIFFPPLLVLFLASVTWTLLIHTLASEAAESGDPRSADRVVSRDLRRMTIWATVASLVLAALLFITLPRVRTNMLNGMSGKGIPLAGFSDRVTLGDVGRIRMDRTVVMRVESVSGELPEPSESYWRGLAFDHFDGTKWSISTGGGAPKRRYVYGVGRFGIDLNGSTEKPTLAQRILREPVEAGVLFLPGDIGRIEGPFQNLERDRNGGLYLPDPGGERIRYTVWGRDLERDSTRLRRERALSPVENSPGGPRSTNRYLQLPVLPEQIATLGQEIASDEDNDFDRATALRNYLRRVGRYTDSPPPLGDGETSPIEAFILGDLEGHCEYFASAMVVLARSQGLPARLVNGFAGGLPNEVGDFVEVSRADAHAWVEIHFEDSGWVRFDPTPLDLRLRSVTALSLWERAGQFGSALELWWYQRVVDFDSADQIAALRGVWRSWNHETEGGKRGDDDPQLAGDPGGQNPLSGIDPLMILLGFVALLTGAGLWHRVQADALNPVPAAYLRAQKLLSRAGVERTPSTTARDFEARVAQTLPPEGAAAFHTITDRYLAERFGDQEAHDLAAELSTLKDAVNRMRLGNQSHVR